MKTCLFAGTFDPITKGHYDTVKQLLNSYDKVYVAIGVNPEKTPLFPLEDRLAFLTKAFNFSKKIVVDCYTCLTVEYMLKNDIQVLVRGIRNQRDLEFEKLNEQKSKAIYPMLKTEYVKAPFCDEKISSTFVRECINNNLDFSGYVPKECYEDVKKAVEKIKMK